MRSTVRILYRASAGFVGGAVVGIVGCLLLVMGLDLISLLLSFLVGHQLPAIVIGFLAEGAAEQPGQWVLSTGTLRIVAILGAIAGAIWQVTTSRRA